jgi:Family of unknown function (DUF5706)
MDERESIAAKSLGERDKLEFLWRIHDANQAAIRFADTKAGAILGFALAMTGLTFSTLIQTRSDLRGSPALWGLLVGVLVMSISLLLTLVNTLLVILPRRGLAFDGCPTHTDGPWHEVPDGDFAPVRGHLYFGDIARSSIDSYREALQRIDPEQLLEQLARDAWQLSRICERKYHGVRWSLWWMTSTAVFSLLVLLLIGLGPLENHPGFASSSSTQVAASIRGAIPASMPQRSPARSTRSDFPATVR